MENNVDTAIVQNVILDTCILQYFSNKNIQIALDKYLLDLINRKFTFYISEISIAELLTNLNKPKEKQGLKTLSLFERYSVEQNVLIASAQLSSVYNKVGVNNIDILKIDGNHISLADRILGATAILN